MNQSEPTPPIPAVATPASRKRYAILAALTVVILCILFFQARGSWGQLSRPHWGPLLAAVALTALFLPCMTLRWVATLWAGRYPVTFREAALASMAAWPLGTITPSKTGDLAKAFCVRHHAPLAAGLGSVAAERAMDVFMLLLLCLYGGIVLQMLGIVIFALLGLAGALTGSFIIMKAWRLPVGPKWQERLASFRLTWHAMARRPQYILLSGAGSLANWLLSIWQVQLLYRAYGCEVSLSFVCAALPVAVFIGLLPLTIAGMGTRDKTMMTLFAPYAPPAVSLSVGILYSICGYWIPSLVGLPFMRRLLISKSM